VNFWMYLLLSLGVVCYVAALTGNRSERLDADAWEHHRAVLAMSQDLWQPGNPTYATDEPTIRYSPYTVALAWIVHTTGVDAYDALSAAAVFNTILLLIAIGWWLHSYGLLGASWLVLPAVVFLYGQPPGYANSFALSDLPWHQVNPSALAMALMIFTWAWLSRAKGIGLVAFTGVASVLLAFAVLSHGMSGILGAFGMFITAIGSDRDRVKRAIVAVVTGIIAFGIATLWPWYDFLFAVTQSPDKWYWFNPAIFRLMILVWCLPAMLGVLATLPMRSQPFIRTALLATVGLLGLACVGAAVGSPTLARVPLAGLIFPQAAIGVYLYQARIFDPRTWLSRLMQLASADRSVMSPALVDITVAGMLIVFALPNVWLTLSEPHLARKWVSPLLGKEDKQPNNWQRYEAILTPYIETRDVVLAEPLPGWPVPSFGGRVVSALHLEFFTPGQFDRLNASQRFFLAGISRKERVAIMRHYDVSWLLLDRTVMAGPVFDELFVQDSVVRDDGRLVLMDAEAWGRQQDSASPLIAPQAP
jgi:hypothetical protein